ncbi:hypothetical protein HPMBJEAJ_00019 [Aeromonas phage avDM6]|nr:hypothetical protein HPMBJEAJ_00019 [Aeromonas phage avDM6]
MSKVKTYHWKDYNSKVEWIGKINKIFGDDGAEYELANKLIFEKDLVCVFNEKWPNDVDIVNGKSVFGLLIFVEDDINNFLVEVGTEQKTENVETWYKWKNSDSPVLWKERVFYAFQRNWNNDALSELENVIDQIHKKVSFIAGGAFTNDKSIFTADGLGFKNQILFLPHEVEEYLVEVGSQVDQQQVKQVDTMPESGIFTAVWIEDGFLKSEDFFSDGVYVKLQRVDVVRIRREELLKSLPSNTIYMVIE